MALKDVSTQANHHLQLESIVSDTSGPPGTLYTSHAATALLETLETGGPCARLVPGDTATAEQRQVFDAFCTKLGEGGLVRICRVNILNPQLTRTSSVYCDGELRAPGLLLVNKRRLHQEACIVCGIAGLVWDCGGITRQGGQSFRVRRCCSAGRECSLVDPRWHYGRCIGYTLVFRTP